MKSFENDAHNMMNYCVEHNQRRTDCFYFLCDGYETPWKHFEKAEKGQFFKSSKKSSFFLLHQRYGDSRKVIDILITLHRSTSF